MSTTTTSPQSAAYAQYRGTPFYTPAYYPMQPMYYETPKTAQLNDPYKEDNQPLYSRLFVVCTVELTEAVLRNAFEKFGAIQYIKTIRPKPHPTAQSPTEVESKGLAYIKFEKASSAALAMETLNCQVIPESGEHPLKVMIAEPKASSNHPASAFVFNSQNLDSEYVDLEDQPPRSRLFVVCSKEAEDEDIQRIFADHEKEIQYCRVVKNKHTGKSKGFAYVKFNTASAAAQAMEAITENDATQRIMVADPKGKWKDFGASYGYMHGHGFIPTYSPNFFAGANMGGNPYARGPRSTGYSRGGRYGYNNSHAPSTTTGEAPAATPAYGTQLFVALDKTVDQDQLSQFVSKFEGLELCELKINKYTGLSKGFAFLTFNTTENAQTAKNELDGKEITEGSPLRVSIADPQGTRRPAHTHYRGGYHRGNRYQYYNPYSYNGQYDTTINHEAVPDESEQTEDSTTQSEQQQQQQQQQSDAVGEETVQDGAANAAE